MRCARRARSHPRAENENTVQTDGDSLVTVAATRLTGAGYVLDEGHDMWRHRKTNRMLDARVAETMTFEELLRWIVGGYAYVP